MAKPRTAGRAPSRRRLPLTARLSLLVLFAAILPLAAVVGVNDYFARGTLIQQGTESLKTDAAAKSQVIRQYMLERTLDGLALASLPTAQDFLACSANPFLDPTTLDCANALPSYAASSVRAINVGIFRDPNYAIWSIYGAKGKSFQLLLSTNKDAESPVAPEDVAPMLAGGPSISPVYYDPQTKQANVRIYSPIIYTPQGATKPIFVGFLRATLRMDYVYSVVGGELGANGRGSYAFMVDANGVRIADSKPEGLFTAIKPLDAATQQLIANEQRYGSTASVPQENLPDVAATLGATTPDSTFQTADAAGSTVMYQFARSSIPNLTFKIPATPQSPEIDLKVQLGWTYFSLSPLSTVTLVADDQLKTSLLSAGVVAILAILLGLLIGRRTASPVQGASGDVENAAVALKLLASRQESSASEQQWVVDACKTGLDSVRYLSDAMNQAARRIMDASNWFNDYWDRLTEDQAKRTVQHLLELSRYVDEAARRQQASSERLDKAITVTIQVSDQLVAGASAATQSADALEHVVSNLQRVVGGRQHIVGMDGGLEQMEQLDQMAALGVGGPPAAQIAPPSGRGGRPGRMPMPMPQAPRPTAGVGAPMNGGMPAAMGVPGGSVPRSGQYAPRAPRAPWNAGQPSQVFDGSYPSDGMGGYSQWGGAGQDQPGGYPANPRSRHNPGRNGR